MCGILTLISAKSNREQSRHTIEAMIQPLRESRGPDAYGIQEIATQGNQCLLMAHARLSIIDLSDQANQPMVEAESGLSLIFNGEIYNYLELRQQLEGSYKFRTRSDTEVLLAALKIWGLEKTLSRLRGMFAFIFFDPSTQELVAVRDRAGEKPLSYGKVGKDWVFSSDLRVLKHHPLWNREVSLEQLKKYFQFRFIPHPESVFKGFHKLSPGTYLKIKLDTEHPPLIAKYWSLQEDVARPQEVRSVQNAITEAVRRTTVASDVPVGTFLSGGVDSSLVTALAALKSSEKITAYTLQFAESDYDESAQASAVARALKIKHVLVPYSVEDFKQSFAELNRFLDEPVAVHSFYPLGHLARRARQDVKVCLSGDGGDELFAGYNRYLFWNRFMSHHSLGRQILHHSLSSIFAFPPMSKLLQKSLYQFGYKQIDVHFDKIKMALESRGIEDYYIKLLSQSINPLGKNSSGRLFDFNSYPRSEIEAMMIMDFNFYLPGDVLNKVDRATMACGLEARAPLLDLDVIQSAWQMPLSEKLDHKSGKKVLKKMLNELVPGVNFDQTKMGFTTPLERWSQSFYGDSFYERVYHSPLKSYMSSIFLEDLSNKKLNAQLCFTIDSVLSWLEINDLSIAENDI